MGLSTHQARPSSSICCWILRQVECEPCTQWIADLAREKGRQHRIQLISFHYMLVRELVSWWLPRPLNSFHHMRRRLMAWRSHARQRSLYSRFLSDSNYRETQPSLLQYPGGDVQLCSPNPDHCHWAKPQCPRCVQLQLGDRVWLQGTTLTV